MLQRAKEALQKYYGYPELRDGQEKIMNSIFQGRDTLGIMPTGGGKSVCFQIPALLFPGLTLVISPLISLMKDQVDTLKSLGIPATFINSSLEYKEVVERIQLAKQGKYKILYVAPERLELDNFRTLFKTLEISLLAIDEAHCISQWGHDFRPSYRSIAPFIKKLPKRPIVAAFTATATEEVTKDIVKLLSLQQSNVFIMGFDRPNLTFSVLRGENKRDFLLNYLQANPNHSGIIYAATRKEVDTLTDFLNKNGHATGKYHAGMNDQARINSQEAFLYDDLRIIVATNAFGMGIDKSNVRFVIHYNMPKNMEAYYQEAGRAGRDGEPGDCILLYSAQDIILQKFLIENTIFSPERQSNEYKKLQIMVDYCHTPKCLREYILNYFGEENVSSKCNNCSTCNDDREIVDITKEAQIIFSCLKRMHEQYGITMVADVLKGSKNKKIMQAGFDRLSTYGLMNSLTVKDIKDTINVLVAEGYIYLTEGQYPIAKLQDKAISVLKGQEQVFHKLRKTTVAAAPDNSLFELLRTLRKEISAKEGVPPFVVFSDSSLKEMCSYLPIDQSSMLAIKGVGQNKWQNYGQQFITLIKKYVEEHGLLKKPSAQTFDQTTPTEDNTSSHVLSYNMFTAGKSIKEIALVRNLKPVTIENHIIRCATEGLTIDWQTIIPNEYEALILEKIQEKGPEKLKPIKEALPNEVEYLAIKGVLCKYNFS